MISEVVLIFAGSFTLALTGALMPGPLLTITIADSARRGFIAGPLLMIGHAALELALVVGVWFGLGKILELSAVKAAAALAGGLILLWMGQGMIRAAPGLSMKAAVEAPGSSINPVANGILASLSNPYWLIWWATVGLGYLVSAQKLGIAGVAVFFVGHISADFAWYSAVSLAVSRGRTVVSDKVYRSVIRACGALLLGFGAWFVWSVKGFIAG